MGKIIKIIYLSIFLLIAIIAGYLGLRYSRNITQTYPYPYQMNSILLDEITQAQGADIVLIGDSSSSLLNDSLKGILDNVAKYLERAPIVYDWGREAETMAPAIPSIDAVQATAGVGTGPVRRTLAPSDTSPLVRAVSNM